MKGSLIVAVALILTISWRVNGENVEENPDSEMEFRFDSCNPLDCAFSVGKICCNGVEFGSECDLFKAACDDGNKDLDDFCQGKVKYANYFRHGDEVSVCDQPDEDNLLD